MASGTGAAFAITTASSSVALDAGGTAQVAYTVTNTSGQQLQARGRVVPEAPAQAGWFSVVGGEQPLRPGDTLQAVVQVTVPLQAPGGTSRFRLDVIAEENPDELFGEGPWISLEVRAAVQPPRRVPRLWILVAIAAVAVVAGGTTLAWVLTHRAPYPDGTLLNTSTSPEVDRMDGGQRRWIPDPPTLNCMGLNGSAIKTISESEWEQIPQGEIYPSRQDGALLEGSGPRLYVITGCQRHLIPDVATFIARGYSSAAIQRVSDADLTAIPEGAHV